MGGPPPEIGSGLAPPVGGQDKQMTRAQRQKDLVSKITARIVASRCECLPGGATFPTLHGPTCLACRCLVRGGGR